MQYVKELENYVVWLEECPSFLEHACAHDMYVVLTLVFNGITSISYPKKINISPNRRVTRDDMSLID